MSLSFSAWNSRNNDENLALGNLDVKILGERVDIDQEQILLN